MPEKLKFSHILGLSNGILYESDGVIEKSSKLRMDRSYFFRIDFIIFNRNSFTELFVIQIALLKKTLQSYKDHLI